MPCSWLRVDAHPRLALVLAANRDEYHARPAAPATWGRDAPFHGVLAGRDLTAGGTWLAVRCDGRFALVTNVRDGKGQDPAARSRGELSRVLALAFDAATIDSARYNGFNLVTGDARGFAWMSNRSRDVAGDPQRHARPVERAARRALAQGRAERRSACSGGFSATGRPSSPCSRRSPIARQRPMRSFPRPA